MASEQLPAQRLHPHSGDALVVVDVQRDFLPGGALAVPRGDEVVAPLARCVDLFQSRGLPIIFTRDWHPPNHCSFREQGGPWPAHCIAETEGARFAAALRIPDQALIVSKATAPDVENYSDFEGTHLADRLKRWGVKRLFVGGLATEYCVRATVLDALRHGFGVVLLTDAVRPIDPRDGQRALAQMLAQGAVTSTTEDLT
jgi:nicotinamidase/pyrazinamidase